MVISRYEAMPSFVTSLKIEEVDEIAAFAGEGASHESPLGKEIGSKMAKRILEKIKKYLYNFCIK